MDCRLPGSSVHEIFQARILEWVAISFSMRSRYMDSKELGSESWFYPNCFSFLTLGESSFNFCFFHADSSRWVFDYKRVSAPIFPLFKSQLYKAYKYALKNQADLQVNLTPARNKSQYSKEGIKNLDSQHENTCSCGRQNFREWPSIFHPLVPRLCNVMRDHSRDCYIIQVAPI